jgi:hypothetical protein
MACDGGGDGGPKVALVVAFNDKVDVLYTDESLLQDPDAIVVMIDVSGSTGGLREAVRGVVGMILMGSVALSVPEPGGGTALIECANYVVSRTTRGQQLFVVTDGKDNCYVGKANRKVSSGKFESTSVDLRSSSVKVNRACVVGDHLESIGAKVCIVAVGDDADDVDAAAYLHRDGVSVGMVSSGADVRQILNVVTSLRVQSRRKSVQMAMIRVGSKLGEDLGGLGGEGVERLEAAIGHVTMCGAGARTMCVSDLKRALLAAVTPEMEKAVPVDKMGVFFSLVLIFLEEASRGACPAVMLTSRHDSVVGDIAGFPTRVWRPILNRYLGNLCARVPEFNKAGRTPDGGMAMLICGRTHKFPGKSAMYALSDVSPSLVRALAEDGEFCVCRGDLPAPRPRRSPSSSPKAKANAKANAKRGACMDSVRAPKKARGASE